MSVSDAEQEAVRMWLESRCERFGETSALGLYDDFTTWLVRSRELRQSMRLRHQLGRGNFGQALRVAGIEHRKKNGRTYYTGIALRPDATI